MKSPTVRERMVAQIWWIQQRRAKESLVECKRASESSPARPDVLSGLQHGVSLKMGEFQAVSPRSRE